MFLFNSPCRLKMKEFPYNTDISALLSLALCTGTQYPAGLTSSGRRTMHTQESEVTHLLAFNKPFPYKRQPTMPLIWKPEQSICDEIT